MSSATSLPSTHASSHVPVGLRGGLDDLADEAAAAVAGEGRRTQARDDDLHVVELGHREALAVRGWSAVTLEDAVARVRGHEQLVARRGRLRLRLRLRRRHPLALRDGCDL